jgi:hypothetical protein
MARRVSKGCSPNSHLMGGGFTAVVGGGVPPDRGWTYGCRLECGGLGIG